MFNELCHQGFCKHTYDICATTKWPIRAFPIVSPCHWVTCDYEKVGHVHLCKREEVGFSCIMVMRFLLSFSLKTFTGAKQFKELSPDF